MKRDWCGHHFAGIQYRETFQDSEEEVPDVEVPDVEVPDVKDLVDEIPEIADKKDEDERETESKEKEVIYLSDSDSTEISANASTQSVRLISQFFRRS